MDYLQKETTYGILSEENPGFADKYNQHHNKATLVTGTIRCQSGLWEVAFGHRLHRERWWRDLKLPFSCWKS